MRKLWRELGLCILAICAIALAGCDDSPGKPKEKWGPEWTWEPSGSSDGSVYFVRAAGGDYKYGTYRTFADSCSVLHFVSEYGDPPKISPCGDELAVVGIEGALWLIPVREDSGYGAPELVHSPTAGSIGELCWQGCGALVFSVFPDTLLLRISLINHEIDTLTVNGREPSSPKDGEKLILQKGRSFFETDADTLIKLFDIPADSVSLASEVSRNGDKVLYDQRAIVGEPTSDIWLYDHTLGSKTLLRASAKQPTWVADDVIAFVHIQPYSVAQNNQVWVMNIISREAHPVTSLALLGFP